jgi:hypothetical protein
MATTMTQEQRNERLPRAWGAQGQEQRNEWLQRAWDAQGEGHVLPRRPPKDRDDHPPQFYPNRRAMRPRR